VSTEQGIIDIPQEDTGSKLSRRDVIVSGIAAAMGVVGGALIAPATAAAANGDPVNIGTVGLQDFAHTSFTGVQQGYLVSGPNQWAKLCGTDSTTQIGVWGVADQATGIGVSGSSSAGVGVQGVSGSSVGVSGTSGAADNAGVAGLNNNGGTGVSGFAEGSSAVGVVGNSITGTGVSASSVFGTAVAAVSPTGTALNVSGKTHMSRSGVGTIAIGKSSVLLTVPTGLTASSKFLVTMQQDPGSGVFVRYVSRYSSTRFKVVFNKNATRKAKFAWMVLD
jgi:hypothetical protein